MATNANLLNSIKWLSTNFVIRYLPTYVMSQSIPTGSIPPATPGDYSGMLRQGPRTFSEKDVSRS